MRKSLLAALCVVGVASCGGGSSSTFSPGVAGDKKINTLTPAEQQTICNNLESTFTGSDFVDRQCRFAAVLQVAFTADDNATDTELQMQCATAYAECKTEANGGDGGTKVTCDPVPANCTATVDQLTACVNDSLAALKQLDAPACNKLTRATLSSTSPPDGGLTDPMESAACKAYQAACPDDQVATRMGMLKAKK
jgi:hypothetical protein